MDTTLMTFHLQTSSSTQSVHLIGSWDNFTKHYPMERDIRRAHCQWRGCYKFEDIICDGDGGTSPKRTGGLKMGSTYYYYYELDDGTEIHDSSLPFTTSCPFLPGQPLNLLSVPVEVQPLRYRSASMSSVATEDIKTMNPADKFMAPRPPPPTPILPRLKTSPSELAKKRSARSVSPNPVRSPWSPKSFFGLRSTNEPYLQDGDKRGRSSSSLNKQVGEEVNSARQPARKCVGEERTMASLPRTRDTSPRSFKRVRSREPSPLRQLVATQENHAYNPSFPVIPDEIEEDDAEDDENFASKLNRMSLMDKEVLTPLAPPPTSLRFPNSGSNTPRDTSKPLPLLPEQLQVALTPAPLRLRDAVPAAELPGSHFSTSTISTTVTSPTESHFDFSETPSIADSNEDEDFSADIGSGDESTYSPIEETRRGGFTGYSLPDSEYTSEQSLRKEVPVTTLTQATSRATFGGLAPFPQNAGSDGRSLSALAELLNEMSYLSEAITGK